jgi:hypothetical protein
MRVATWQAASAAERARHSPTASVLVGAGGAALGGSLTWAATALVPWLDGGPFGRVSIGLTAIVVGSMLGFVAGQGAIVTHRPASFVVLQACRAVLVVSTVWALAAFVDGSVSGTRELDVLAGYAFVLCFGFLLGMPLALPVAVISTGLLRLAARRPALGVALMLAVVISAGAVATTRPDPGDAIHDLLAGAPGAPSDLRWTVVNRSPSDLVLGIFTREPDGYGGSTMGVPGCRITTGSDGAGASWFVSLDRAEPFETEAIPVAEADGSGARSVWLEVAADGTVTGSVGREPPDVEATLDDLCGPVSAP